MAVKLPQFIDNRKLSRFWLVGIGGLLLILLLVVAWLTRSGNSLDLAINTYKSGDVSQALDMFAQARDKNQINTAEEWNIYGNVYRDSKHLPEAIEAYKKAIKADSGYEPVYRNLAYTSVDLAEQEKTDQRIQQAIGFVENGRKLKPKSVFLVEDLMMLYGEVGDTAKVAELKALREQLLK